MYRTCMFRKDKYEPKDLTKLKFAFEEEVEGVKQNAEHRARRG